MADLVEQLRAAHRVSAQLIAGSHILAEAADEITRLREALTACEADRMEHARLNAEREAEVERWQRSYGIAFDQAMSNGSAAMAALAQNQMVRQQALEDAAKVAERYSNAEPGDICEVQAGDWQYGIATAIRALTAKDPTP